MGLSYNPMQNEAFAMLMSAEGSKKRIPVIIGAAEAQAIAVIIERIKPQRPMTHDLFATMTHAFGVELKEVFIYEFKDGIFSAEMTFSDGERQITLDSRTSDAVAIALRTGAPIYTTPAILEETGVEFVEIEDRTETVDEDDDDVSQVRVYNAEFDDGDNDERIVLERMSDDELEEAFTEAVANDEFERAAIIRTILEDRKNAGQDQ